jgi:outer membrane protein assembly factor BamB
LPAEEPQLAAFLVLRAGAGSAGQQQGHRGAAGPSASCQLLEGQLVQQLRQWLAARLPAAAVPGLWVQLQQLPRSPAGKVLRAELPGLLAAARQAGAASSRLQAPAAAAGAAATAAAAGQRPQQAPARPPAAAPSSPGPKAGAGPPGPVSEVWAMLAFRAVLQLSSMEPTDNFFSWGGSSLAAAELAGQLGIEDLALIYANPTARSLAAALRHQQEQQGQGEAAAGAGLERHGEGEGSQRPSKRRRQEGGGGRAAAPAAPAGHVWRLSAEQLSAAPCVAAVAAPQASQYLQWLLGASSSVQLVAAGQARTVQLRGSPPATVLEPALLLQQQRQQGAPRPPPPVLEPAWRCKLGRCVDAPPLALLFDAPSCKAAGLGTQAAAAPAAPSAAGAGVAPAAPASSPQGTPGATPGSASAAQQLLVCACSHDGDVALIQAATGELLWSSRLPARADAGLAAHLEAAPGSAHIVAACGDGHLYCLGLADGAIKGRLDCRGDIKAPPVLDPWCGHAWATSHARRLVCMRPPGRLLAAQRLPAPSSVAPAFVEALGRRLVLAACLDGSLTAFKISGSSSSSGSSGPPGSDLALDALWVHRCSSPLFSRLALEPAQRAAHDAAAPAEPAEPAPGGAGVGQQVLCCEVHGRLHALDAGSGQPRWSMQLPGHVFAALSASRGLPGCVLAATQGGQLCCVSCSNGAMLWQLQVGQGPMSAPPVVALLSPSGGSWAAAGQQQHRGGEGRGSSVQQRDHGTAASATAGREPGTLLLLASSNKGALSVYLQRHGSGGAAGSATSGSISTSTSAEGQAGEQRWELQQEVELPGRWQVTEAGCRPSGLLHRACFDCFDTPACL